MRCIICDAETSGMTLFNPVHRHRKFYDTPSGGICEECYDESNEVMQDFYESDLESEGNDAFEYDGTDGSTNGEDE